MKFVIAGLLLLLGAGAVIFMLKPGASTEEPKAAAPAPEPEQAERVNPLAQQDLLLEEEPEEDAAVAEVEEPEDKPAARKPRPSRDPWDCAGDLDRAGLQKVLASNRAQVRTCYERRLKVNNLLQGDLSLRIKIGANGSVASTSATGSLRDKEVFDCVRKLAKDWKFPAPSGGNCAVIQVPFQFSPKN